MATPVLNNGIFLRDTNYQASSHVDSYHLVNMLKTAEPMDLGPVDIWAMAQKVEMPLYQLSSFGGKNIIMVDNARGEYKWQTPVSQELPYIIENIIDPANTTPGIDGTTFQIKINMHFQNLKAVIYRRIEPLILSLFLLNFIHHHHRLAKINVSIESRDLQAAKFILGLAHAVRDPLGFFQISRTVRHNNIF